MSDDDGSISGPTNDEELAKAQKRLKHIERQARQTKKGLYALDPGSDLYIAVAKRIEREEAEAARHRMMNELQNALDGKGE